MAGDLTFTQVIALIGAFTGVSGLGLSIYNAMAAANMKRAKVRVHGSYSIAVLGTGQSMDVLTITCANVGHIPVTLSSISLKDKATGMFYHSINGNLYGENLPKSVGPGEAFTLNLQLETLKNGIRRNGHKGELQLWPFAQDQVGRQFLSKKPIKLDL